MFRERFERLYDLEKNKEVTVANMPALGWSLGGEGWKWWRRLFA